MSRPFRYAPDPDLPGWHIWDVPDPNRYNALFGPLHLRIEGERSARLRAYPQPRHSNLSNVIHGGAIMGFADLTLVPAGHVLGVGGSGLGVTLECSVQFLDSGKIGEPLDAVVEIMRETGRLVFFRGTMTQGTRHVATYSAILRKAKLLP